VAIDLAELLERHWADYARDHRQQLDAAHYRAVRCVLACRTPAMGGRVHRCGGCRRHHYAYHSCNHRSCPKCGARDQQEWTARQEARLLPVPYFMVTFTLPVELRPLCLARPEVLYDLMLRESAAALQDVIATKHGGARGGFTSVLHTWGRQVQHHPHVHVIVPAVALHPVTGRLVRPAKDDFLVHFRPLAARFRSRLHDSLKNDHPDIYQQLTAAQRRTLSPAKTWNVQFQPVGQGKTALRYLARYVRRSAFSSKRLLGYDAAGDVRLAWTSSADGKTGVLPLSPHELIRRWLLHVLPKGLPRIRHYGFLSPAAGKTRLKVRAMLGEFSEPLPQLPALEPFACPHCGGELTFLRDIAPVRIPRGPPHPMPAIPA
jgi:hypothetical protein